MSSLKDKSIKGAVWTVIDRFSLQLINFVVSIFLARILMPEDFGLIGMIMIVMSVGQSLRDSGFAYSLIRKQKIEAGEYSTIFFSSFILSLLLYGLIYFIAPLVSAFYEKEILTSLLRVFSLKIIIDSLSSTQNVILIKSMKFKKQFFIQLPAVVISGCLGIYFALSGVGVFSIVYMHLIQAVLVTALLWIFGSWRPKMVFLTSILRYHFSFGYKLSFSNIIEIAYNNIYYVTIGKFFNAASLGFYTRANSIKELPAANISFAVMKVTFPAFSEIQDNQEKLKEGFQIVIQQVFFIITPILLIAGVLAKPLFNILFTEKWLEAVPIFQILCIAGILLPLNMFNSNMLLVKGKSDWVLKIQMVSKLFGFIGVLLAVSYSFTALLWFQVVEGFIVLSINAFFVRKLIGISPFEQLKSILPLTIINILVGFFVYVCYHNLAEHTSSNVLLLILITIAAVFFYIFICYVLHLKSFVETRKMIKLLMTKS